VDNPYPGPRAFRLEDQDLLFGRGKEAAAVTELWRANRLTVLSGPSACGKTSLLRAGVYPLMTGPRVAVLPLGEFSAGPAFPVAALPEHNPYTLALLRSWAPDELTVRLAGQTLTDFARRRAQRHPGLVYAAIDQADYLFAESGTGPRARWRRLFLGELAQAIADEPRLHVLLSVRNDVPELIAAFIGSGARYSIAGLSEQATLEAITAPAMGAGRLFVDGAAQKLVTDLRTTHFSTPGEADRHAIDERVEPLLLQVACARLWRDLPAGTALITARDVRVSGDADTALAAYCSQVIAAVAAEHDLTSRRLRTWLSGTFVTGPGTRRAEYQGTTETVGMPNALLQGLVDRQLLSTEVRSGLPWYQLLTDRLIEPLRRARDQRPPRPGPGSYLSAARRALTAGDLDLTHRRAEQALRARPELQLRAEAESLLGNVAHERERPGDAETRYREAAGMYEATGDTTMAARLLAAVARTLIDRNRVAEAVGVLRAVIDRLPNDSVTQSQLGMTLWQLGDGRAAVAVLTSVLAIDGGNPEALRLRGEILADLGSTRDAKLDLDRQTARGLPSTQAAHGLVLAQLGNQPAAAEKIDAAISRAPRNGHVLLFAARASALAGDQSASGELARRALDATDPPLSAPHREQALRLAAS
jgi:tetratricopeptide (TPR) repeat protein